MMLNAADRVDEQHKAEICRQSHHREQYFYLDPDPEVWIRILKVGSGS